MAAGLRQTWVMDGRWRRQFQASKTILTHHPDPVVRPSKLRDRLPWLPAALSAVIALCLVVPESEIRAKAFKMNLIVKNVRRVVL